MQNDEAKIMNLLCNRGLPEECIESAANILKEGNLYRYSCDIPEESEVALLEKEIAEYVGAKYSLGVNSCGSALYIALLALGVKPGDEVLMSVFTYTAVPSAIINIGATPVFVECTEGLHLDTDDLKRKINGKRKVLIVSYMRGMICNVEKVVEICHENDIFLIEDCAHSLGGYYNGKHTGTFGIVGCFSTQSHKLLNSGEGGILVTNDEMIISKAILYAGSQETFWKKHFINTKHLDEFQNYIPNISLRMSNLVAAILRPQIKYIDTWKIQFERKFRIIREILRQSQYLEVIDELESVSRIHDTIQFKLNFQLDDIWAFINTLKNYNITIQYFGYDGNPRYYRSWKYIKGVENITLAQTDSILKRTLDLRLPKWLTEAEVTYIGQTIVTTAHLIGSS